MSVTVLQGDCRTVLPTLAAGSVHCCVTSPPYFGLRDYGHGGQIGLEPTPDQYVAELVAVFREVRRVLRDDGTVWLNLGDSYANDDKWGGSSGGKHVTALHGNTGVGRGKKSTGLKAKDLCGIPWRVAFALQADGWYLRQDIIWSKPNPMPESVTDRCTKAHEYVFLLAKSERYHYDAGAVAEQTTDPEYRTRGKIRPTSEGGKGFEIRGGLHAQVGGRETRNRRSVWTITTKPYAGAHFATFPPDLVQPCIAAGCPVGGTVLDPFGGSGTTAEVAVKMGRRAVLVELNPEYVAQIRKRLERVSLFAGAPA